MLYFVAFFKFNYTPLELSLYDFIVLRNKSLFIFILLILDLSLPRAASVRLSGISDLSICFGYVILHHPFSYRTYLLEYSPCVYHLDFNVHKSFKFEMTGHQAVAVDVFDGVLLFASLFQ